MFSSETLAKLVDLGLGPPLILGNPVLIEPQCSKLRRLIIKAQKQRTCPKAEISLNKGAAKRYLIVISVPNS